MMTKNIFTRFHVVMAMKISPIISNNRIINSNTTNSSSTFVSAPIASQADKSNVLPAQKFYLPTNFKANETKSFEKDMRNLQNIHCPVCGVKMLSKKEIMSLLAEGERIKSINSFIAWLERNEESIPENYKKVISSAKRNAGEYGTKNIEDLIHRMRESAFVASENAVDDMKQIIAEAQKQNNYSDSDNVLLDECFVKLDELEIYGKKDILRPIKEILQDTVNNLEDDNAKTLYYSLMNTAAPAGMYQRLFPDEKNQFTNDSYRRQFLQNIFNHSFSSLDKIITNFVGDRNIKQNLIMTCQDCKAPESSHIFKYHQNNPKLKENFVHYLEDVGKNVLNDKVTEGTDYVLGLIPFVKKITAGHINVNLYKNETLKEVNVKEFYENQEKVDFEPVKNEGVPCASCGDMTITHNQKLDYFKEIESKKDMHGLADFLKEHSDAVNTRYKSLVEAFLSKLEENPDISEIDMVKFLKIFTSAKLKAQLASNVKTVTLKWSEFNSSDKALIQEYIDEVNEKFLKLPDNKPFPYEAHSDLLKRTIYLVSDNNFKNRFGNKFKESIRKRYSRQLIMYPRKETVKKVGSPMKVIVEDIFKGSVATVDHFVAKDRNGWERLPNYVVMCKNCNAEKTNYSVKHWSLINPEFGKNLQKYLNKIVEMIKKGELSSKYESYPAVLASSVSKLTDGKIVLRFDKNNDKN